MADRNKFYYQFQRVPDRVVNVALASSSLGSTYFSHTSFSNIDTTQGQSFEIVTSATIIAIVTGVLIYFAWRKLIDATLEADQPKDRQKKLIVMVFVLIVIFGISSWPNVSGIAGNTALDHHQKVMMKDVEHVIHAYTRYSNVLDSTEILLKQEIASLKQREINERRFGAESGTPGEGDTRRSLGNMVTELSAALITVQQRKKVTGQHLQSIQHEMVLVRRAAQQKKPIAIRQIDVATHMDKVAIHLAALDQRNFLQGLQKNLALIPDKAVVTTKLSKNPTTREEQLAAIAKLKANLEMTIDNLNETLALNSMIEPPAIPQLEPMTAMRAVGVYALEFGPAWMVGLGIDMAPALLIVLLMISKSSLSDEELRYNAILQKSVEEILENELARETVRRGGSKPHHIVKLIDQVLGEDKGEDDEDPDKKT